MHLSANGLVVIKMAKVNRGFTLIELMIVVLIVGLMLLVAAPFTSAWTESANLTKGKGVLTQAIGRAKAAALRNRAGAEGIESAAAVCIDNSNTITVRGAIPAVSPTPRITAGCPATGTLLWTGQLPNTLEIEGKVNGSPTAAITCLKLDNRAFPLGSSTCAIDTDFKLKSGSVEDDAATYY